MNEDAKGPILIAAAITMAATLSTQYSKKGVKGSWFGPSIAVFIMLIFLFLLAEINAKLAILFAWLIAAGSLAVNGQALFALLQSAQSGKHVAPSTTPQPWVWPSLNPFSGVNVTTGSNPNNIDPSTGASNRYPQGNNLGHNNSSGTTSTSTPGNSFSVR
jgi:hypothetical protein